VNVFKKSVSYFVEQVEAANVSPDHYKIIFKPSVVVPRHRDAMITHIREWLRGPATPALWISLWLFGVAVLGAFSWAISSQIVAVLVAQLAFTAWMLIGRVLT